MTNGIPTYLRCTYPHVLPTFAKLFKYFGKSHFATSLQFGVKPPMYFVSENCIEINLICFIRRRVEQHFD